MVKSLIVLVLGILLLGGAAFGGWHIYNTYLVPQEGAEPKKVEPPPKPPTGFVRMAPIIMPVIGNTRVEQIVTVVVTMEVLLEKQPMVQANQVKMSDVFRVVLYGGLDDKSIMKGALFNIPAAKEKLMEAAAKAMGPGVIVDVLIQAVVQRNL